MDHQTGFHSRLLNFTKSQVLIDCYNAGTSPGNAGDTPPADLPIYAAVENFTRDFLLEVLRSRKLRCGTSQFSPPQEPKDLPQDTYRASIENPLRTQNEHRPYEAPAEPAVTPGRKPRRNTKGREPRRRTADKFGGPRTKLAKRRNCLGVTAAQESVKSPLRRSKRLMGRAAS